MVVAARNRLRDRIYSWNAWSPATGQLEVDLHLFIALSRSTLIRRGTPFCKNAPMLTRTHVVSLHVMVMEI